MENLNTSRVWRRCEQRIGAKEERSDVCDVVAVVSGVAMKMLCGWFDGSSAPQGDEAGDEAAADDQPAVSRTSSIARLLNAFERIKIVSWNCRTFFPPQA